MPDRPIRFPTIDLPIRIQNTLRTQLNSLGNLSKEINILVGAIFPIAEGIVINLLTGEAANKTPWLIALSIIGITHLILLIFLIRTETPLPQFIVEFDEIADSNEKLENEATVLELYQQTFVEAITCSNLSLVELQRIDEQENFESAINAVLMPWINSRTELFWFIDGSSLYNIGVYISKNGLLTPVIRSHDNRLTLSNRNWRPGDGHIGTCFLQERSLYWSNNGQVPDALESSSPRPEDNQYYNCVIASPISANNRTIGVVVITSSTEGQFDKDVHTPILENLAMLLSQVCEYYIREERP